MCFGLVILYMVAMGAAAAAVTPTPGVSVLQEVSSLAQTASEQALPTMSFP